MTPHEDDVVRVASGSLVEVELWQTALTEAGIESRVVGTELSAGLGSALPTSTELWVHSRDFDKATAAIRFALEHRDDRPPVDHGIPKSDRIPDSAHPERKRTYPN
jgi:Putative prokaryotic signal transducing protein